MELRKNYFADERKDDLNEIGHSRPRSDAPGHVTGKTVYFADRTFPDLLHLKMVRSPHHHAKIRSIDTSEAEKHPGVIRVLTAKDVPHNVYTILILIQVGPEDETVLADKKVSWKGEAVVAVVATSERAAQEAAAKVKVDYEVLPAVFDVLEALKPDAPEVNEHHPGNYYHYDSGDHRKVRFGDVQAGFAAADHILEETYSSSPIEQAPTETTGCIVAPEGNDRFTCYTNTQAMFFTLDNASIILQMPGHKLHMVGGTVGGGFGGKVDVIVEPIAILAAKLTGRPVSFIYSREEEMQISSPRAAETITIKDGVTKDGRLIARQVTGYTDAGAYSRHSPYGAQKGAAHYPGPYTVPNVWIDTYCVYTNRTPSSAMRGFGVTIADFALEVQMDKLARLIGMDPLEFRFINAYRDGDMKAHRQPTEGAALIECMQEAARVSGWPVAQKYLDMSSRTREA
ncbi:Molybdopterin-binding domain of aldehyde dehydrogenase/Aldehyde oxidase and xanthine dehydrogenase, a/b hammerhead domain [Hoeflea sp. IMCC20628]|uniref:xanthine dehydrogenase family protein molybdopterin-binding subunit n=1 Tax=Hoeflea sp. IMCC20628 TaxID=1620421 RepID=UPI00063AE159|nr:xanthine dehydrogenase family protein molybdopterin-binding subunit [Hoeflea sp. IMCC20628]AKI01897.1 Molybdopterin-binding domain of aldehyde dehydrogenase/Aldehyde oxidase and xanthine dehydrogenase, a/b hammerhead domain [Hoeflea sp. IMCC20628]